jgi:hypothetical protein
MERIIPGRADHHVRAAREYFDMLSDPSKIPGRLGRKAVSPEFMATMGTFHATSALMELRLEEDWTRD